ncbi:MAG: Lrp/AsnC family transcriptional regulator [Candidatus Aenigmatarchaeota archaeon]
MGQIDEKDMKILKVLEEHGDYTTRQISKKTLLPATTIHNRIKNLKKIGVIKKFTVDLDHSKVDKGLLVYVLVSVNLQLLKQRKKSQYDIANEIRKFYFTDKVDIVSGGTDLMAVVRVKDVQEFDKVLLEKLQMIEGIEKTQSLIVIHED